MYTTEKCRIGPHLDQRSFHLPSLQTYIHVDMETWKQSFLKCNLGTGQGIGKVKLKYQQVSPYTHPYK